MGYGIWDRRLWDKFSVFPQKLLAKPPTQPYNTNCGRGNLQGSGGNRALGVRISSFFPVINKNNYVKSCLFVKSVGMDNCLVILPTFIYPLECNEDGRSGTIFFPRVLFMG